MFAQNGEAYPFFADYQAKQKGWTMWYVIQVRSGMEDTIMKQCEKIIDPFVLQKSFIPRYEQEKKYQGAWHKELKPLFPGYVFLVSEDKEALFFALKKVPDLTKLLGTGEEVVALTREEIQFLARFGREKQIVEMSRGIMENDRVIVTEGPLKGNEGLIWKIDRHKRRAYLAVRMFGRTMETQVGLEIVAKK